VHNSVKECIFDRDAALLMPDNLQKLLFSAGYIGIKKSYHLFFPRHKIFRVFLNLEKKLKNVPLGGQYCITAQKT
jgi:hypothetical protein